MKVGIPQETCEGVDHVSTGSHGHSPSPEDSADSTNAINSIHIFSVCGMRDHLMDECHILINAVNAQDFIKAHPDVSERICKSHKTFFHHKPRPRGPHVHNIPEDLPIEEDYLVEMHDDHPSLQFNADEYIYHLHDSSSATQEDRESTSG
jgi:hypothetical protein